MTDRAAKAIASFLDAYHDNQMAFEQQRAFATAAEAGEAASEFWLRLCDLHRAIGREPPAWPAHLSQSQPEPMI